MIVAMFTRFLNFRLAYLKIMYTARCLIDIVDDTPSSTVGAILKKIKIFFGGNLLKISAFCPKKALK